jgi:hypothetical protein
VILFKMKEVKFFDIRLNRCTNKMVEEQIDN